MRTHFFHLYIITIIFFGFISNAQAESQSLYSGTNPENNLSVTTTTDVEQNDEIQENIEPIMSNNQKKDDIPTYYTPAYSPYYNYYSNPYYKQFVYPGYVGGMYSPAGDLTPGMFSFSYYSPSTPNYQKPVVSYQSSNKNHHHHQPPQNNHPQYQDFHHPPEKQPFDHKKEPRPF